MTKFTGVITALATPFKEGQVDKNSFVRLIKSQLDQGVDGFVINGTTGESPTLTWNEVEDLFNLAKNEVAGQVPLIIGTGSNNTQNACELSARASRLQADAVLSVVPYYNRPPQRGLLRHFQAVAEASSVPVILYNVPSRTVAGLEAETIAELARNKNIVGIKEATGNMDLLAKIKSLVSEEFILLSGDDASSVEFCRLGGHGVISVSSHIIGAEMKEHIAARSSADYQKKYAEFFRLLYIEANPIPLKMALHWMGIFNSPELRPPLVALDERYHKDFRTCLAAIGKL